MRGRADHKRFTFVQRRAADFTGRVGMTEIDRHIAIVHRRLDCVAEVALRYDLNFWLGACKVEYGFPHATGCAYQQHAHGNLHLLRANSSNVLRKRAWFDSVISHNGKRTAPDIT